MSTAHTPFDTRIFYKECTALARHGYDVTLVIPADGDTIANGVRIKAVARPANRSQRFRQTIREVYRAALAEDADIYHFHDPELIPVGLLLRRRNKRVIYDVHENVPRQIRVKDYIGPQWLRRLLSGLMASAERAIGPLLDAFVVAAPSIQTRFPPARTVLVRNFVELAFVDAVAPRPPEHDERFVVIYPGSLSEARGIRNVVQAMAHLQGRASLWLLGRWQSEAFHEQCRQSDGWQYTSYLGEKTLDEVIALVKSAQAGVHLPLPSPNYSDGLAVKGFEFMACGLPFVTTDEPGKRQTFADCALFADPGDPRDIAAKISQLLENRSLRDTLGRRGRDAVEREYSWEHEAARLLDLYASLSRPTETSQLRANRPA